MKVIFGGNRLSGLCVFSVWSWCGGSNVFDTLAQLSVLVTTPVGLFCSLSHRCLITFASFGNHSCQICGRNLSMPPIFYLGRSSQITGFCCRSALNYIRNFNQTHRRRMWEETVALRQIIQDPVFQILSCDPCKTRQDTICSSESLSPE